VRVLTSEDVPSFRVLRLEALESSPASFGAHIDDEAQLPIAELARRIEPTERSWTFGAFDALCTLRGMMGWYRERGIKREHRSMIWGAYVQPAYRRSGVAAALLAAILVRARAAAGLRQVQLHVASGNAAAKSLYAKFGFRFAALHPESLRVGERFIDEELWILRLTKD